MTTCRFSPAWLNYAVILAVVALLCCQAELAFTMQVLQDEKRIAGDNSSAEGASDDWQKAVDYLERLGLHDRKVQLFEQQLRVNPDASQRKQIATKLASIYSGRILAGSIKEELLGRWQEKATNLLALYPDLENPALRVAVFHARFNEFSLEFDDWWSRGRDPRIRQDLQQSLQRLIAGVVQSRARMLARINTLIENRQIQGDKAQQLATLIEQNETALLHTGFVLGWSKLYEAIFYPAERERLVGTSEKYFREVLQIDPGKPLSDLSADWFFTSSSWVRRATLGVAIGKQLLDQADTAQHLFDLLLGLGESSDFVASWKLKSVMLAEQNNVLLAEMQAALQRPIVEQRSTWAVAAKYIRGLTDPEVRRAAELIVLQGLARTRQGDLLLETVYSVGESKEISDPFLKNWIQGYVAFVKAESASEPELAIGEFELAKTKLQRALDFADQQSIDTCVCEFLLAQLDINDSNFSTAEKRLSRIQKAKSVDPELAGQAAWLRVQALLPVVDQEPNGTSRALLAIDFLQSEFQNSPYNSAAQFQKLKLESRSIPILQAIDRFQRVTVENENYPLALFELVRLQFKVWLKEFSAQTNLQAAAFQRLHDWELRHRKLDSATASRKLKALLFVIDAGIRRRNHLLTTRPNDPTAVEQGQQFESRLASLFDSAERIISDDPLGLELGATELLYYRFLAERDVDDKLALELAEQLVERAAAPNFLRPALIFLAQQFDDQYAATKQVDPLRGVELYTKLLSSFESESLAGSSKNREITLGKLASYQRAAKNWKAASQLYSQLVAKSPKRVDYLAGLAQSRMELGEFASSADVWRTIIAGTKAGADAWLEAKLGLVICLSTTNPENALRVLKQTQRLYPNMPKHWLEKFDLIKSRLDK